jgi:hypothetical protein
VEQVLPAGELFDETTWQPRSDEPAALEAPAPDTRALPASVQDMTDTLNLAERLVAELGAWAGMLAERWSLPLGPFFASDGRMAVDSARILCEYEPSSRGRVF